MKITGDSNVDEIALAGKALGQIKAFAAGKGGKLDYESSLIEICDVLCLDKDKTRVIKIKTAMVFEVDTLRRLFPVIFYVPEGR